MGLIFGAKCEECWERVEACTCGRYTKLDDYGPTVRYNKSVAEAQDLRNEIQALSDKLDALIETLRNKDLNAS